MDLNNSLTIGQNIALSGINVRVGVIIVNPSSRRITFLAFLVPKDSNNKTETIFIHNKSSECGKIVLYGTENHLTYDIDLRFLSKKHNRLVFAIKTEGGQEGQDCHTNNDLLITLNIERVAIFHSQIKPIITRIARIGEIYDYQ